MNVIKKLSVVVPVYNEENTIGKILDKVAHADSLGLYKEIIIIDDCSTDNSVSVINEFIDKNSQADDKNTYIFKKLNKNGGKTSAIKQGISLTTGDVVLIQDADLEYDPADYPVLIEPFLSHNAHAVYGSRFLSGTSHRVLYYWHSVGNRFLTTLSNFFTNLNLTDMETGYKVFDGNLIRKIAPTLTSTRFGFEPEITAKISKIPELRLFEVGVRYWGRTYAEGKKIEWKDGAAAIYQIIFYNLFGKG